MKVKKALHAENYYYLVRDFGNNNKLSDAEFSDQGNIKIAIFFADAHQYIFCYELLYKKFGLVWEPLYNNGRLL